MKRMIPIVLILALCLGLLAGCKTADVPETTKSNCAEAPGTSDSANAPDATAEAPESTDGLPGTTTEAPALTTGAPDDAEDSSAVPTEVPDTAPVDSAIPEPASTEPGEPAERFDLSGFLIDLAQAHPDAGTEELCSAILESPYFTMYTLESTEYYYPGFAWDYEVHDVRSAHCAVDYLTGSGSLVYVIEPEEGVDIDALASELFEKADPGWSFSENGPDSLFSIVENGKIFLAMYHADMQPVTGPIAETARDFVELFHARRAEQPEDGCLALADWFISRQKLAEMYTAPVEPGRLTGFGSFDEETEITGFAEGALFNPMLSPNTFIGYVFRLEEGADQEAFIAQLRDNANLAWNVCVEANTIITETDGDYVLFMMCTED